MTKATTKLLTVIMVSCILLSPGVLMADEAAFLAIYEPFIEKYKALTDKVERASWEARTTGSPEAFKKKKDARLALVTLLPDADRQFLTLGTMFPRFNGTFCIHPIVHRLAHFRR